MVVSDEQDREGIEDFVLLSSLAFCLSVDVFKCLLDSVFCVLTCETSIDEVVEHVNYNKCIVLHGLVLKCETFDVLYDLVDDAHLQVVEIV